MSIEFTISLDKKELIILLNHLLLVPGDRITQRLGQKLEFIIENLDRDEEDDE